MFIVIRDSNMGIETNVPVNNTVHTLGTDVQVANDYVTLLHTASPSNKRVTVSKDGDIAKHPGAPIAMAEAEIVHVPDMDAMVKLYARISNEPNTVLILGTPIGVDESEPITVLSKKELAAKLGCKEEDLPSGVIEIEGEQYVTRTKANFQPSSFWLFDYDIVKGMPEELIFDTPEQWWEAMCEVFPNLSDAACIITRSTSSRILKADGSPAFESGGWHAFVQVEDADELERFRGYVIPYSLSTRYGFMRPVFSRTTGEQIASRPWTIFDPTTFSQERLVYDGKPVTGRKGGLTVAASDIVQIAGGRFDTSGCDVSDEVMKSLEVKYGLTVSYTDGVYQLVNDTDLTPELEVITKSGVMTVEDYWNCEMDKLRCQTPFRPDSTSWAAYLNFHTDGSPFLYDVGTQTKYVMPNRYIIERDFKIEQEHKAMAAPNDSQGEQAEQAEQAEQTDAKASELPALPDALASLPYALGDLQARILSGMLYPDRALAGFTALAALAGVAQTNSKIEMPFGDITLMEWFVNAAKTGYGKDYCRQVIKTCMNRDNWALGAKQLGLLSAEFGNALPSSAQGLHTALEADRSRVYVPDEFGDYIASANAQNNSYKRETMAYAMEIYTTPFGTVCVPQTKKSDYTPVDDPRITIFASTTPERLAETMSASQADSGTYNRMIILVANATPPPKNYDAVRFELTNTLMKMLGFVATNKKPITMSQEANAYMRQYDTDVCEKYKHQEPILASRINEQAIKLAGLICLSDKRVVIEKYDLEVAYAIRVGLYKRASVYFKAEGNLDEQSDSSKAAEQVFTAIERNGKIPRSMLGNFSRKFAKLEFYQQEQILKSLVVSGLIQAVKSNRGLAYRRVKVK